MLRRALPFCLLASCSRTPSQNPTPPPAPSASAAVDSGAPAPPRVLSTGDGCHAGISLDAPAEQVLDRVRKACTPDSVVLRAPSAETGSVSFEVKDPGACLRIVAVGSKSANLELALKDDRGVELARDTLPGAIALVSPAGPVCVASAGKYRLELGAAASVGVWRAP